MQTIQKRKQWVLIALALIVTLTLQLFTPIVVHAEEETNTRQINISYTYGHSDDVDSQTNRYAKYTLKSDGHIKMISYVYEGQPEGKSYIQHSYKAYIISDEPIYQTSLLINRGSGDVLNTDETLLTTEQENGYYWASIFGFSITSSLTDDTFFVEASGLANIHYLSEDNNRDVFLDYLDSGEIDLSKDDYKELVFDESTATYNSDIPTPKLTVNNDYSFGFNNASDGYYIQIKGRWYSVDDIELYKENLQWKYKYNSILKGSLTDWVSSQSNISVISDSLNFSSFGQSAFDSFLSTYPIDNRSYTGGTNALGNFFSGYNDALSTLKMLLGQPTSIYNGLEVYVRYYTFDANGNAIYGKWCHYYDNLASSTGSSGSQWDDSENMFTGNQSENGLDDEQFTTVENMTDSRNDIDLVPEYNNSGFESIVLGNVDTTSLVSTLESMYTQTSSFINMIGTVFNFLPSWVIAMICASLGLVCIIGMWKCIKG